MLFKFKTDVNGNKRLVIKNWKGGFSVQTNGNLPLAHRLDKTEVENNKEEIYKELKQYTDYYGTQREKDIMESGYLIPVKVIFENSTYNYTTNVNGLTSTKNSVKKYFVNQYFDKGIYPAENMQKCIKVKINKS